MDHENLLKRYPAVQVYSSNSSVGYGNRVVYWVGSDGRRAVVFNCMGDRFTIPNSELSFVSVIGAFAYSFENGRLRYQGNIGATWIDAGPLNEGSVKPDDPSIRTIIKQIGSDCSFDELMAHETDDDVWENEEW